jgi:hypothetical protein
MAKTRGLVHLLEILSDSVWRLVVLVDFLLSLAGDQDRVRSIASRQISAMPKTRALDKLADILRSIFGDSWY